MDLFHFHKQFMSRQCSLLMHQYVSVAQKFHHRAYTVFLWSGIGLLFAGATSNSLSSQVGDQIFTSHYSMAVSAPFQYEDDCIIIHCTSDEMLARCFITLHKMTAQFAVHHHMRDCLLTCRPRWMSATIDWCVAPFKPSVRKTQFFLLFASHTAPSSPLTNVLCAT